jgi:hypothetical protein
MTRNLIRVLLLFLATALVFAQNRANFPWWNSPVRNDIGLTPAQNQRIRQIVRSYRDRLLDARNAVQKAQLDLEDLFNDPEVSPQAAQPIIERLAEAHAVSNRVFLSMSTELRSVLTLDQWRQLVRRWDEVLKKKPPDTQVPPQ